MLILSQCLLGLANLPEVLAQLFAPALPPSGLCDQHYWNSYHMAPAAGPPLGSLLRKPLAFVRCFLRSWLAAALATLRVRSGPWRLARLGAYSRWDWNWKESELRKFVSPSPVPKLTEPSSFGVICCFVCALPHILQVPLGLFRFCDACARLLQRHVNVAKRNWCRCKTRLTRLVSAFPSLVDGGILKKVVLSFPVIFLLLLFEHRRVK